MVNIAWLNRGSAPCGAVNRRGHLSAWILDYRSSMAWRRTRRSGTYGIEFCFFFVGNSFRSFLCKSVGRSYYRIYGVGSYMMRTRMLLGSDSLEKKTLTYLLTVLFT